MTKEYTDLSTLTPGKLYYKIGFSDGGYLSPLISPMVYLGMDLIPDLQDEVLHYFQDAKTYIELGHFQELKAGQDGSEIHVLWRHSSITAASFS